LPWRREIKTNARHDEIVVLGTRRNSFSLPQGSDNARAVHVSEVTRLYPLAIGAALKELTQ
jgi:hypothetical protein